MKNNDAGNLCPETRFVLTPAGERALAQLDADPAWDERIGLTRSGRHVADCIAIRDGAADVLEAIKRTA